MEGSLWNQVSVEWGEEEGLGGSGDWRMSMMACKWTRRVIQ